MLKRIFLSIFLLNFLQIAHSQNEFGEKTITIGATQSFLRGVHKIKYRDFDPHFQFTTGGQLHMDFALLRRFSIGFGGTFHRHQLQVDNYSYHNGTMVVFENFRERIDVFSGYGRALFHMKNLYDDQIKEVDLYWGGQMMFLSYHLKNNSTDPNLPDKTIYAEEIVGFVGGIRYYPTDSWGFHAEAAFPGAYTISIGAAFRFGARDRFFRFL
jgi:hypothetical protein